MVRCPVGGVIQAENNRAADRGRYRPDQQYRQPHSSIVLVLGVFYRLGHCYVSAIQIHPAYRTLSPSPSRLMGITLPQIDDGSTNTFLTPPLAPFSGRMACSIYYFPATDRRGFRNGNSVFPLREVSFGKFSIFGNKFFKDRNIIRM